MYRYPAEGISVFPRVSVGEQGVSSLGSQGNPTSTHVVDKCSWFLACPGFMAPLLKAPFETLLLSAQWKAGSRSALFPVVQPRAQTARAHSRALVPLDQRAQGASSSAAPSTRQGQPSCPHRCPLLSRTSKFLPHLRSFK